MLTTTTRTVTHDELVDYGTMGILDIIDPDCELTDAVVIGVNPIGEYAVELVISYYLDEFANDWF